MTNLAEQIDLVEPKRLKLQPWMPSSWRAAVAGKVIKFRAPEPVRRRLHVPKPMKPSELSVKYRHMPAAEAHEGNYRYEFAKHARKVMDTWVLPWVKQVWFCGVDQASKTNTMLSCIFWTRDQAPGNIFYQMPDEKASDKIMGRKLIPMFKESARMARHLSPRANDMSLSQVTFADGMAILPAWAGSPTSTATFSALYTFSDEIDKMEMVGKEASPIERIRKRSRAKKFGKHFFSSTPAGKYIYEGTMACQQVWVGTLRCPECGELMTMDEKQVVYPEDATDEDIKDNPDCVEYACDKCGHGLTDGDREEAYRRVESDADCWVCIKGQHIAKPEDVGFLLSAFPIPDVSLSEIAQKKIKSKTGDLSDKRDFAHSIEARNYKEEVVEARDEESILKFKSEIYARGVVPVDTALLALLVDTQQSQFYYQIWAYGYAPLITMHMVQHDIVPGFCDLDYLLEQDFFDPDNRKFRNEYGLIDSGGTRRGYQKHSRTVEVYNWCSTQMLVMPLKGVWNNRDGELITYKQIEVIPGTSRRYPPGMVPTRVNARVNYFKDELARHLAMEPDNPSALSFHSGVDKEFAKHYCSEGKNAETGEWIHDRKKGRNDYFDINVYAFVLRDILKTRIPQKPSIKTTPIVRTAPNDPRQMPSWFNRR